VLKFFYDSVYILTDVALPRAAYSFIKFFCGIHF